MANKKTKTGKKTAQKLTRRKRLRQDRDEQRAALKEFTSFHPDNETAEYLAAKDRLERADRRRADWWR